MDITKNKKSTLSEDKKFLVPIMGKNLIITEKPSVARQFASALNVYGNNDGYIENDNWVITWCVGHLVTLSYPQVYDPKYERWDLNDLPFLPDAYKYEVIKNVKDQFKVVKGLLNRSDVDTIYNAGDSGREGEYIQRLVFQEAGINGKKKIMRVWIDSQTDDEIKRGIKQAKPSSEYDNLSAAAYMRGIEDYSIGINLSRALSCKFGYEFNNKIGSKKYTPISVGRVMTCVLGMIVARENEIKNFKPTDYYKINALHKDDGFVSHWKWVRNTSSISEDKLYNNTGLKDEKDCDALIESLNTDKKLTVVSAEKKTEKKAAPLLYNLAELQNECSKKFKIDPDKTLAVAQALYEAKLTTYPRTDARVLSTAVANEIDTNLNGLNLEIADNIITNGWHKGLAKTKYVNDEKITDHYAIIPTGQTDGLSDMSELEQKVYKLILLRFLAIFYPAAEYSKVELVLQHSNKETFTASEKVLVKPGFLELYQGEQSEEKDDDVSDSLTLEKIKKGDVVNAEFEKAKSTTQPPKRYTSGSLILAMENAGNLIEEEELREQIKDCGIGTSATRASVIKKLCTIGYIALNNKTQVITPTDMGFAVVDIVNDNIPKMLLPKFTANWEKGLSQVEHGEISDTKYYDAVKKFVIDSVNIIKSKTAAERPQKERKVAGKCPRCGSDLYETDGSYYCSAKKKGDKKSCQFSFSKSISGSPIPESEIEKLLSGNDTDIFTVTKEGGKTYECLLKIMDNGEVKMKFPSEGTEIECPKCGKMLAKTTYKYECDCGFNCWHTVSGKTFTAPEMKEFFANMITGPVSGFTNKAGNPYEAYILFDGKNLSILQAKMAGRNMSMNEYLQLITEGKTEVLHGFKGKSGDFDAALKIVKGEVKFDFPNSKKSGTKTKKTRTKK